MAERYRPKSWVNGRQLSLPTSVMTDVQKLVDSGTTALRVTVQAGRIRSSVRHYD